MPLLEALTPFLADVLVIVGTQGLKLFLGVVSLCASSVVTGDPAIIYRVVLISVFLLITTPISAFVIARAAFLSGEKMTAPGAVDESDRGLPAHEDSRAVGAGIPREQEAKEA